MVRYSTLVVFQGDTFHCHLVWSQQWILPLKPATLKNSVALALWSAFTHLNDSLRPPSVSTKPAGVSLVSCLKVMI